MRKQMTLFAILAMLTAVSLTACKKKETVDLSGIHTAESTAQAETMTPETTAASVKETEAESRSESAGSNVSDTLNVRAKIATEKSGNISIEYPILSNLRNADTEKAVNEQIKNTALRILDARAVNTEKDNVTLACDVISLDRSKAIFAFEGSMKTADADYATALYYTLSVDLSKGTLIGLSDYADPYTMAGYMISDDCVVTKAADKDAAKKYLSSLEIKELWETLKNCDFNSQTDDAFPQAFSYENQGVIYISIPVSHELGDYVIVEFHPETK